MEKQNQNQSDQDQSAEKDQREDLPAMPIEELRDADLHHLKKSDLYSVSMTSYRLIKHYRLKIRPDAPINGIMTEIKDLKADGFDVEMAHDERTNENLLLVNRVEELTDLGHLRRLIQDEA